MKGKRPNGSGSISLLEGGRYRVTYTFPEGKRICGTSAAPCAAARDADTPTTGDRERSATTTRTEESKTPHRVTPRILSPATKLPDHQRQRDQHDHRQDAVADAVPHRARLSYAHRTQKNRPFPIANERRGGDVPLCEWRSYEWRNG